MPNKRAENQVLLSFACDADMLRGVDAARKKLKKNRSQFFREAIVEELARLGVNISDDLASSPDRVKKPYPAHQTQGFALNEVKSAKKK